MMSIIMMGAWIRSFRLTEQGVRAQYTPTIEILIWNVNTYL